MEEPFKTVVAGMMCGVLMGMLFVGHLSLLLVYSPPRVLKARATESKVSGLITVLTLTTVLSWNIVAVVMAFVAQATQSSNQPGFLLVPSPAYLFVVGFVVLLIVVPGLVFFRDKKKHLGVELVLFTSIFGLLMPNLVVRIH